MKSQDIARGGLLTAAAVALLYIGGLSPWLGLAACVAAGVCSAVPLLQHSRMKTAVLLYVAASVLSALLVPRKGLVVAYIVFAGLYPIVKYAIEARVPVHIQMVLKLLYFNLCLVVAVVVVHFGLFTQVVLPGVVKMVVLWLIANAIFKAYDIGLSRLIATLRHTLPKD